ncbi:DUF7678 domain-containing protein [Dyadobacter frigoris]|uniref:DUF7678 domain-containing protein n=1 Tax=Dyadobacter frigoris TaxID=2576211 RepID=UPI0015F2E56F|nr:hypothetical protein [Dyadobacter frigoris]GLU54402.1 hypothetical protein Dfri01_38630 [Dyadobacter frigoris]
MDKPKLFRKSIYLTLFQLRGLEQLSEYDGIDFSEHLRKAVEQYLKNQKADFSLVKETDLTVSFTESVRESGMPGAYWISGLVDKYAFSALLLGENSKWGIEKGRISKFSIWDPVVKESSNNFLASCIVNYDRGWDIRPSRIAKPYYNKTKSWIEHDADRFIKNKILDIKN